MSRRVLHFTVIIIAFLAGVLAAMYTRRTAVEPPPLEATVLPLPRALPAFNLIDHAGMPFGPDRLAGHWTFLFFGFTHCPDVCPTTLTTLATAVHALDDLPPEQRPHVVLVSVDPERDTSEILARYVTAFDPSFLGVTGEPGAIATFAEALGIAHAKVPLPEGGYTVDHTAAVLLLDPAGRLAAVFTPPHRGATIARDYRTILTHFAPAD